MHSIEDDFLVRSCFFHRSFHFTLFKSQMYFIDFWGFNSFSLVHERIALFGYAHYIVLGCRFAHIWFPCWAAAKAYLACWRFPFQCLLKGLLCRWHNGAAENVNQANYKYSKWRFSTHTYEPQQQHKYKKKNKEKKKKLKKIVKWEWVAALHHLNEPKLRNWYVSLPRWISNVFLSAPNALHRCIRQPWFCLWLYGIQSFHLENFSIFFLKSILSNVIIFVSSHSKAIIKFYISF